MSMASEGCVGGRRTSGRRRAAPTGTVSFLFTDIEGSTRLLEQLRGQYAELLADHRRILREVFAAWQGHEVDTQGDSFFVAFPRAADALGAALAGQRALASWEWPNGAAVRVRMAIHTGEPLVATHGYVGMAVHRAARIAAVSLGGAIVISGTLNRRRILAASKSEQRGSTEHGLRIHA
jgi:class 3 adenylate cyclase